MTVDIIHYGGGKKNTIAIPACGADKQEPCYNGKGGITCPACVKLVKKKVKSITG